MDSRGNRQTRREAIAAMTGSIGCLLGVSGAASAETLEGDGLSGDQSDGGPSVFSGTRRHKFIPDGDVFSHTEYFESDELSDTYGVPEVTFDEGAVPREVVPAEHRDPDEQFVIEYEDTTGIIDIQEFVELEQNSRTAVTAQVASSSATDSLDLDLESMPKYVYKQDETGNLYESSGPINVAWHSADGLKADDINEQMMEWGWESPTSFKGRGGDRYIRLLGDEMKVEDADICDKELTSYPLAAQHHIRAYNLPSNVGGNISVVGQCHHDPFDHAKLLEMIGDHDFDFETPRIRAEQTWRDKGYHTTTPYVGNESRPILPGEYKYSEGMLSLIHHADLEAIDGTVPQDIDNDGLYEDFNGNGRVGFPDLNTLFQNADQPAIQNHAAAYDFTGDGSVDLQDVLAIFPMI